MKPRSCCSFDGSRRDFLLRSVGGLSALSLPELFGGGAQAQPASDAPDAGVFAAGQIPARAKRVICLHMLGAISHVDPFDYQPTLERTHGRRAEAARILGIGLRTLQRKLKDYRAQGIVEGG